MRVSIGVFGANKEQICFLNSCGIIYDLVKSPIEFEHFTHIISFVKPNKKLHKRFITSIMNDGEQIDVFSFCKTVKNGKYSGIFFTEVINNVTIITPLFSMKLNKKTFVIRKGFFIGQKKLPAEEISLLDKGGLQRLFLSAMKDLFHSQNLPFVVKSYSPNPEKIPFLFRIDTDFSDKKTIENYYENIKIKPKISWFVHCNIFNESSDLFSVGESDEFALHCFSHKVKPTNENLQKGIEVLKKFGKNPLGYSAPYGVRNENSDIFLKENYNFEYSSDFSFAADALPFLVEKTKLWQIPIFPLCIGSFNGVCSDENKITAVFERYFARNFKYKIPFIIYDHPNHTKFDLLNKIFAAANKYPLLPMTFLEYCRFLQIREKAKIEIIIDENGKVKTNGDFPVIVFYPNEENVKELIPETARRQTQQKISRFSPRLIKNTIINRLRRRKHDN